MVVGVSSSSLVSLCLGMHTFEFKSERVGRAGYSHYVTIFCIVLIQIFNVIEECKRNDQIGAFSDSH